ncbi:MAG: ACP S-malonyltransferase [Candidatus Hydrogenedentes bacterium]|nr:ACP S-malonyltransferase [Candidatus Hydrogenedentota bacterium]
MIWFLFPGQGSQKPGMAQDYYEASPAAHAVLDQAQEVLGAGFLDRMFTGTAEELRDTQTAQVALVAAGVAIARHLSATDLRPDGAVGHSVGENAALVGAGARGFGDALRLTRERARLMAEKSAEGTMAAVIGLDASVIAGALPEDAEIANFNGPGQTIISGGTEAIEEAQTALLEAGARRVLPLNVSGPFHSSLMKPAALELRDYLDRVTLCEPAIRFVSSVTGAHESDPGTIKELLWKQLYSPVRWTEVMETLGPVRAIEVGPGKVLQGLAKRADDAPEVSVAGTLEEAQALALI